MIGYLSGKVVANLGKSLIVDVNGVGYEVLAVDDFGTSGKGAEVELFIHSHVREDQITLYGFVALDQRQFFRQLISVSGIGPKTALEMLNQPMNLLKQAIVSENADYIAKTPGIGKKTAQKVVIELKNKVEQFSGEIVATGINLNASLVDDAVLALEGLGYRRHDVLKLLQEAPEDIKQPEEMVRFVLKSM